MNKMKLLACLGLPMISVGVILGDRIESGSKCNLPNEIITVCHNPGPQANSLNPNITRYFWNNTQNPVTIRIEGPGSRRTTFMVYPNQKVWAHAFRQDDGIVQESDYIGRRKFGSRENVSATEIGRDTQKQHLNQVYPEATQALQYTWNA